MLNNYMVLNKKNTVHFLEHQKLKITKTKKTILACETKIIQLYSLLKNVCPVLRLIQIR